MTSRFRSTIGSVRKWVGKAPWSARAMAVVGLLLALVSAFNQPFVPQPPQYDDWGKWAALGLALTLLAASAWYAADVRRIQHWSKLSADLHDRLTDLESLHPAALGAALNTVHDTAEAAARDAELRNAVAEVATAFSEVGRAPELEEVARLEAAASAALEPTRAPTRPAGERSDVLASWQSVAQLRATARSASTELRSAQGRPRQYESMPIDPSADSRSRWTEFLGLAAVLLGLLAAPAVATSLVGTEPSNGGDDKHSVTVEIAESDTAVGQVTLTPDAADSSPVAQVTLTPDDAETPLGQVTLEPSRLTVEQGSVAQLFNGTLADRLDSIGSAIIAGRRADAEPEDITAIQTISGFDCPSFYEMLLSLAEQGAGLPSAIAESPYWKSMSIWCGDGPWIIEQLKPNS